jgi:hypothetical protein
MELNDADKAKAQDRFIKNLDVNSDNKKLVLEKINLLLKKDGITVTEKDLSTLLKTGELAIDSSKKISIDLKRIFYLLGECGNESFGVQINKISVTEIKSDITVAGTYTGK